MTQCPECASKGGDTSKDNLGVFDNGSYCFACNHSTRSATAAKEKMPTVPKTPTPTVEVTEYKALPHRKISSGVCALYKYGSATDQTGQEWEVAQTLNAAGDLVKQKLRKSGTSRAESKKMFQRGQTDSTEFFGRHLVRPGGKLLVVTEGEIDAMSVCEAQDGKWPAISVPNGASHAEQAFRDNIEYLNTFDKVIIMFDQDDAGKEAAKSCSEILRPGKAYIAKLPLKDASDCLVNNNKAAIRAAIWDAEPVRQDGIVHVRDIRVTEATKTGKIYPYPYPSITRATYGRRPGCVDMLTSGSGMGKSTFVREMIHYDISAGHNVGAIMLEESTVKTKQDILSVQLGKPIHKILASRLINAQLLAAGEEGIDFGKLPDLSEEELAAGEEWLDNQGLYLFDHFGSLEVDVLTKRIEYLHYSCGCDLIYLDHVSIVVSGTEGDERRDLDMLMTTLKSMAERTGVCITTVCHLRKPSGQAFEEGGQISLSHLRGSGSLYQLSDSVLGFERNQQHTNNDTANTMGVRLLKDRFGGNTGLKAALKFDHDTHRLISVPLTSFNTSENE